MCIQQNETVNNFYSQENEETKAIVFCEYRESVFLINRMLLTKRPLIKPKVFVGMSAQCTIFLFFTHSFKPINPFVFVSKFVKVKDRNIIELSHKRSKLQL